MKTSVTPALLALAVMWVLAACTHRVAVEPITINMNVKIEHEIKVKVENDLEDLFQEDDQIF